MEDRQHAMEMKRKKKEEEKMLKEKEEQEKKMVDCLLNSFIHFLT